MESPKEPHLSPQSSDHDRRFHDHCAANAKEIEQAIANPGGQQQGHHKGERSTTGNRLISATLAVGKRQINRQITDRIGDGEHTNGGMQKRQRCTDVCFKDREGSRHTPGLKEERHTAASDRSRREHQQDYSPTRDRLSCSREVNSLEVI